MVRNCNCRSCALILACRSGWRGDVGSPDPFMNERANSPRAGADDFVDILMGHNTGLKSYHTEYSNSSRAGYPDHLNPTQFHAMWTCCTDRLHKRRQEFGGGLRRSGFPTLAFDRDIPTRSTIQWLSRPVSGDRCKLTKLSIRIWLSPDRRC